MVTAVRGLLPDRILLKIVPFFALFLLCTGCAEEKVNEIQLRPEQAAAAGRECSEVYQKMHDAEAQALQNDTVDAKGDKVWGAAHWLREARDMGCTAEVAWEF